MNKTKQIEFVLTNGHKLVFQDESKFGKIKTMLIVSWGMLISACYVCVIFFDKLAK